MLSIMRKTLAMEGYDVSRVEVGDQIIIPLEGFGIFEATAHKVNDDSVLFMFDEIVARQPMNKTNTNEGGFEKSQLHKWLQETLLLAFPADIRPMIKELTIPTVGQITGWEDSWDRENLEPDNDEQLPLMKERKNRMALFNGDLAWYWLRNATKKKKSASYFAIVANFGYTYYISASLSYGVRPVFLLTKEKFRGPVPQKSGRYPFGREDETIMRYCYNDVIVTENLFLRLENMEKENEIDILKQKINKLEENKKYDEVATEMRAVMDSFIRAGFTEKQAFDMVKGMLAAVFGGMLK